MKIRQLHEAQVHVHTELSGIAGGLDDEELMAIKALKDEISN